MVERPQRKRQLLDAPKTKYADMAEWQTHSVQVRAE